MTRDNARQEIGSTAATILSGALSFIEGARKLSRLRFAADLEDDADLITFVAIDSETDALPLGEVRKLWRADALSNLQSEIDKAQEWARNIGQASCERLVKRFGS